VAFILGGNFALINLHTSTCQIASEAAAKNKVGKTR
jgi:hypothetical protein